MVTKSGGGFGRAPWRIGRNAIHSDSDIAPVHLSVGSRCDKLRLDRNGHGTTAHRGDLTTRIKSTATTIVASVARS